MDGSHKSAKVQRYLEQTREDILTKLDEARTHLDQQTRRRRRRLREESHSLDIRY